MGKEEIPTPLPLLSLNHVSLLCKSVQSSTEFYLKVLGFQLVRRPSSFDFEGAWLFNYGVGIHLLECKSVDALPQKSEINPRDNHVSFQCADVGLVEKKLQEMKMKYEKRVVEDGGVYVDQLFFHDPDGYMIEICNCENLPIVPLKEAPSCVNRSRFPWFSSPKSTSKKERKESCTEISLVPISADADAPPQTDFKKGVESNRGEERRCSTEADKDRKPLFLDIMNFYL